MKEIKGEKYYISLGYIKGYNPLNPVDAREIVSVYMKNGKNTNIYIDDSDNNNVVALPLTPVNEIQKKDGKFKFRVLINPNDIQFSEEHPLHTKINVIGLFKETKDHNLKFIQFFDPGDSFKIYIGDNARTISVEIEENKILN